MKQLDRRLEKLEHSSGDDVYGVQKVGYGPDDVHVTTNGITERMSVEEWERRYPTGSLIRIVYIEGGKTA